MSEVLLLGGSIPALVAALELAKVGIKVRVAGASARLPQRPVCDPGNEVTELLDELAAPIAPGGHAETRLETVRVAPTQTWLMNRSKAWKPQPFPAVFGIPTTVPITTECVDMLGTGGAFRAYLDRVKPLLTIGKQENFAKLVESRIGKSALELLVEPLIFERFGVRAADVEVSLIAPGLNEALTRSGSLTGGAFQHLARHVARETQLAPEGGWKALEAQLRERLELFGATELEAPHVSLERVSVTDGDAEQAVGHATERGGWIMTDDAGATHRFDAIIVDDRIPAATAVAGDGADLNFGLAFEKLAPSSLRVYAEIGIESPIADAEGVEASESLRIVTDRFGARWATRVRSDGEGDAKSWALVCSGPVVSVSELQSIREATSELADFAGAQRSTAETRVWAEAAPRTTHVERDAQEAALDAWHSEWQDVLACSEVFSGGDLGAAISHAREHATRLRRRLTGIAE